MVEGYRFKLAWPATSMLVRVNAKCYDEAYRKVGRWLKKGAIAHFVCRCEPWPPDRREKMPKKVF